MCADGKYELNLTTLQMCILLMFNVADRLTYTELTEILKVSVGSCAAYLCVAHQYYYYQIPVADFKRNIMPLVMPGRAHPRLLMKEPHNAEIDASDVFTFNADFKTKGLRRVKFSATSSKETAQEKKSTYNSINEDRKWEYPALFFFSLHSHFLYGILVLRNSHPYD